MFLVRYVGWTEPVPPSAAPPDAVAVTHDDNQWGIEVDGGDDGDSGAEGVEVAPGVGRIAAIEKRCMTGKLIDLFELGPHSIRCPFGNQ